MANIDQQTISELEFDTIKELLSSHCKSSKGKENALKIRSFDNLKFLQEETNLLKEIKNIHEADHISIPHPSFNDIQGAMKILRTSNGVLIIDEIVKIYKLCIGTRALLDFAIKNKNEFPLVHKACNHIERINEVLKPIEKILDERYRIKDNASTALLRIREQIESNRKQINRNFERVLRKYKKDEIIGDIEENFLENRRLLSVLSQHRKRVQGKIFGTSSGGILSYVEPIENQELNKSQENLWGEERNEIFKILQNVSNQIRSERTFIEAYQRLLIRFDLLNAKVLFSNTYKGIIPEHNDAKKMYWADAKHPLLFLKNEELKIQTLGQEIELNQEQRFLVISGPNAGGKSITLKTIGLLQVMFQCGLFVPVKDVSEFCWFNEISSDIGDNQSIEDQLSTYSYRLQRMKTFMSSSNSNSLLLLDEFGSGSDPELGGALAEVIYETLYNKKCFAGITTHYTNIKILTSSLPHAVNSCMLFDTQKLKPLYQLSIGQPGSSFTFEVAKNNGIKDELIEAAKQRVSEGKIKIDALSVALQKEKSKFKKVNAKQFKSKSDSDRLIRKYDNKLDHLNEQAQKQALYFEQNHKYITTGKKIFELIKKFKHHKTLKALNEQVEKILAIEKQKALSQDKAVVLQKELKQPELPTPKNPPKKKTEKTIISEKPKLEIKLVIGDRVKLPNGTKGIIENIKGDAVTVLIGNFKVSTKKQGLEKIQPL